MLTVLTKISMPKDSYMLPNIDNPVDNSIKYKLLSFMDPYSGYNQILMYRYDRRKTTFMIEHSNNQYNVIPFRLKNTGTLCQRIMSKVFREEIGKTLEVYMKDMIVKSCQEESHDQHLWMVFKRIQQYNMRHNLEKCTFVVKAGRFLGFYVTERGI